MDRLGAIQPVKYGSNRNYIDGDVSCLSPYISRGVISTKDVLKSCLERGFSIRGIEKFVQELAWRDYWQRVGQQKDVNQALKNEQSEVGNFEIPSAVVSGETGIRAVDQAIQSFYESGYLHNHIRMYIASICTNVAKSHWELPAQWMHYHLLDADFASNALSWQWVCGANSNKKYYANQENINRFCKTNDQGTFLDVSYEEFPKMNVPEILKPASDTEFFTKLPEFREIELDETKGVALYTWYNMDPKWRKEENLNRILLLEPSHFEKYPISKKSIEFLLDLGNNIEKIQVFVGEFSKLRSNYPEVNFFFKEHPTNAHFVGTEDSRDWLSSVNGYYPSFFSFWKKVKKEIFP